MNLDPHSPDSPSAREQQAMDAPKMNDLPTSKLKTAVKDATPVEVSFQFFPKLPAELRYMIWQHAAPGPRMIRIVEISKMGSRSLLKPEIGCLDIDYEVNAIGIIGACTESGRVAKTIYKDVLCKRDMRGPSFDVSHDIIYFDWYNRIDDFSLPSLFQHTDFGELKTIQYIAIEERLLADNLEDNVRAVADFEALNTIFILHDETPSKTGEPRNCGCTFNSRPSTLSLIEQMARYRDNAKVEFRSEYAAELFECKDFSRAIWVSAIIASDERIEELQKHTKIRRKTILTFDDFRERRNQEDDKEESKKAHNVETKERDSKEAGNDASTKGLDFIWSDEVIVRLGA